MSRATVRVPAGAKNRRHCLTNSSFIPGHEWNGSSERRIASDATQPAAAGDGRPLKRLCAFWIGSVFQVEACQAQQGAHHVQGGDDAMTLRVPGGPFLA